MINNWNLHFVVVLMIFQVTMNSNRLGYPSKCDCFNFYLNFINSDIDSTRNGLMNDFFIADKMMESEGENWPAIEISSKKQELVILLESNWMDKKKISRVSVTSGNFMICDESYKLQKSIKEWEGRFSEDIPVSSDGSLLLKDRTCKSVLYEINTDLKPEEIDNLKRLNDIPKNSKVVSVIFMDND